MRVSLLILASAVLWSACGDNGNGPVGPGDPVASSLQRVGAEARVGSPTHPLRDSLAVRVLDQKDKPFAGALVVFEVTNGDGTVSPDSVESSSEGIARAEWTLGGQTGAVHSARVYVAGATADTVTFRAVGEWQAEHLAPITIERLSPDPQQGAPTLPTTDSLAVRVLDQRGEPFAGSIVQFLAGAGGGSVSPQSVATDSAGIARAEWRMGPGESTNTASAFVAGAALDTIAFTAQASWSGNSQIDARVAAVSEIDLSMLQGCALPGPVKVQVTNAAGQPLGGADIYFSAAAGGGSVSSAWRTTDANGMASVVWTLGSSPGANRLDVRVVSANKATMSFTAEGIPVRPDGYAAAGNTIYHASCRKHRFFGISRPSLESWHRGDDRLFSDPLARADFQNIRSWGSNIVRIPINQQFWLRSRNHDTFSYTPEEYRTLIDQTIQRAQAAGLDVILDLHYSDRGDPDYGANGEFPALQHMPDRNRSIPFWRDVASRYKDNGRVLFELYNEPHPRVGGDEAQPIDWDVWLNGGTVHDELGSFQAAGMQELYDAVRGAGAHNLVIVNGPHWGYYLDKVPTYTVRGYNVMYGTHPYEWSDKKPEFWDRDWGFLARKYPVFITEFGSQQLDCQTWYYTEVLKYADQHELHWIAWAWFTFPPNYPNRVEEMCLFASLIDDWNGTPTPKGQVVKDWLSRY